jgi:hypothetical protein
LHDLQQSRPHAFDDQAFNLSQLRHFQFAPTGVDGHGPAPDLLAGAEAGLQVTKDIEKGPPHREQDPYSCAAGYHA